jgi:hypothetical protein
VHVLLDGQEIGPCLFVFHGLCAHIPVKGRKMTFAEKMQDLINKGVAASKDLGAMGALKLEIMQLQSHVENLIANLGKEVYTTLVDANHATVSRDSPSIRDTIEEIKGLRAKIEQKEKEYHSIGGGSPPARR